MTRSNLRADGVTSREQKQPETFADKARWRAAIAIRDVGYTIADRIDDGVRGAAYRVTHALTPRLRGHFSGVGRRVMACGCDPTWASACLRTRPPRPGMYFREPCNCGCHALTDAHDAQRGLR